MKNTKPNRDITAEIIREFRATKLNKLCYIGSGGEEHKDDLCDFLEKALTTRTNELLGAIKMERKPEIEETHYDDCWTKTGISKRGECVCGIRRRDDLIYNGAVDEFNNKLATLKDKYEK